MVIASASSSHRIPALVSSVTIAWMRSDSCNGCANMGNVGRRRCVWRDCGKGHGLVGKIIHIDFDASDGCHGQVLSHGFLLASSVTVQPSCSNTDRNFLSPCVLSGRIFRTSAVPPVTAAAAIEVTGCGHIRFHHVIGFVVSGIC